MKEHNSKSSAAGCSKHAVGGPAMSIRLPNISKLSNQARFFGAVICLLCASSLHAQWTQVWGGDFPGAAGTTYNHANWWNDVQATAVWGDGTIQNTSDSLQNVYLDGNGDLVIAMTYNANNAVPYTSARLTSTYAAGPYGRIDARIQNPGAVGMGAAFWALGANAYPAATAPGTANPSTSGGVPWPWCGELDIMEIQAKTNQHNGSTVHGGQTDGQTYYEYGGISSAVNLTGSATFDNGFHIFTAEWSPYQFTYLLDGAVYASVNLADIGATDQWEFTQPINFILSSGIGGNGGTPNGQGFPSNMIVNYVDYSQWSAGAPAPPTGLTATATNSNAVTLSWTASTTSGVTYDIYATTTSGTAPALADLVAQNVTGTTYVNTGLQPSTTYYYTVKSANYGGESSAANQTVTTQAPGNSTGVLLSAGGYAVGNYMNANPPGPATPGAAGPGPFVLGGATNYHWSAGPPAGLTAVNTSQVSNPAPQQVLNSERWGAAAWTISGLTPLAGYNVRLQFVEFAHTASGQRNFNVSINSDQVLTNFDIFAAAGAAETDVAEQFYTVADENGIIEIQTSAGTSSVTDLQPTVSAIDIIPATGTNPVGAAAGTTADLAINAGGAATGGFVADEMYNGGDTATSTATVTTNANSAPAAVYQSERYVPFTYILTGLVADAPYTVKMHFAETYWTGAGDRIFSVWMNGKYVLNDIDVFKTAGGENIAYDPQFTTSADKFGQIIVQFIYGGVDQPFIEGIEAVKSGNASCSAIPSAPTGVGTSGATSSSLVVGWTAVTPPANCSISSYSVYRSTTSGFTPSSSNLVASGVTGTSYTNTGLAASTTYYYIVEAVDAAGTSGPSQPGSGTTTGNGCTTVPPAPTGVGTSGATSSSLVVGWTAVTPPANCSISSYSVYGSTTSGFTPSSSNLVASGVTSTSYTNTGLAASTTYYYIVEAVDAAGTSGPSQPGSGTTNGNGTCTTVPPAPTGVGTSGATSSSLVVGWTAVTPPANCSISSYSVYGSTTSGFTPSSSNLLSSAVTGTSYTNTGLAASTTYYYVVKATDADGTSAASTQGSGATTAPVSGKSIVSINAGGPAESNSGGGDNSFVADEDYTGGGTYSVTSTITIPSSVAATAAPAAVYQSARQGAAAYTIPSLTAGTSYYVRLHFAELYFSAAASREFNVAINGTTVLTNFDIYATAGAKYTAVVEQYTATANSSGNIVVALTGGAKDQPMINGIEVLATTTTTGDFIAINSGGPAVSNSGGGDASFAADEDYTGGGTYSVTNTVTIPASVTNAAPAAVYQTARQGTVTYTIPGLVAGSSHTVLLHFAELYFSAAGGREFDVAINGTAVLTNFDIYATAGAKYTAVVEQFTATANSSGQIVIALTNGAVDQPMIGGIEIR